MYAGMPVTSEKLMDYVMGKAASQSKIVQEFQKHNDELLAFVERGEYAKRTIDYAFIGSKIIMLLQLVKLLEKEGGNSTKYGWDSLWYNLHRPQKSLCF